MHLAEEDRRSLLRSLHRWLQQLAWIALLAAVAFYLRGVQHPAAGWLSVICLGGAAVRLFWWSREI